MKEVEQTTNMSATDLIDKMRRVTSVSRKRLRLRSEDTEVIFPVQNYACNSALHDIHEGESESSPVTQEINLRKNLDFTSAFQR